MKLKIALRQKNGSYLLETKPMIIGGDEKSLTEQLSEAKNKENEYEQEEEIEDENEEGIRANLPQFDANEFKISKSKK